MKIIRTAKLRKILARGKRWNTGGLYSLEVGIDSDNPNMGVYDLTHNTYDPMLNSLIPYLQQSGDTEHAEVIIEFTAIGSHTPSSWEEPEWTDEDRNYARAYISIRGGVKEIPIDDKIGEALFEKYRNEIEDVMVDTDDTGIDPDYGREERY